MKLLWMLPVLSVVLIPGSWTLTGPRRMDSPVGGSLSVICKYSKGYEESAKFWCKVEPSFFLDRCAKLIESGSKDEARKGSISIKDNKEKHYFEVTMDNLRMEDSGIYKCGVHRKMLLDIKHEVTVNVMFTVPEERLPTTKPEERLTSAELEERVSATKHPEPDTPIKGTVKSNPSPAHTGYQIRVSFLVLIGLKMTILLCLGFAIIWMHSRSSHSHESSNCATRRC